MGPEVAKATFDGIDANHDEKIEVNEEWVIGSGSYLVHHFRNTSTQLFIGLFHFIAIHATPGSMEEGNDEY